MTLVHHSKAVRTYIRVCVCSCVGVHLLLFGLEILIIHLFACLCRARHGRTYVCVYVARTVATASVNINLIFVMLQISGFIVFVEGRDELLCNRGEFAG